MWLNSAERHFLDYMVFKYRSRNRAVAVRTCIKMMAMSLDYDLENDVPPAHKEG
jgi:hypothetical protein